MMHSVEVLNEALKTEQQFVAIKEQDIAKWQERMKFDLQQLQQAEFNIASIKTAIVKLGGRIESD